MSKNVLIKVSQITDSSNIQEDDRDVAGEYNITVDDSVDESFLADCALDVFHSRVAVSALEDFNFEVWFQGNEIEQTPNHSNYSLSEMGSL
jgi:hypothetical protein